MTYKSIMIFAMHHLVTIINIKKFYVSTLGISPENVDFQVQNANNIYGGNQIQGFIYDSITVIIAYFYLNIINI